MKKEEILRRLKIEFQKAGLSDFEFEQTFQKVQFEKGFGKDLERRFPNGSWKTINGARVFINNGKVVAGLDNFNGMIDDFFEEKKKQEKKKDSKPEKPEIVKEIESEGKWNGKVYGSERNGYSVYVSGDKKELTNEEAKSINSYKSKIREYRQKRIDSVKGKIKKVLEKDVLSRSDLDLLIDNKNLLDPYSDLAGNLKRASKGKLAPVGYEVEVRGKKFKINGYKVDKNKIQYSFEEGKPRGALFGGFSNSLMESRTVKKGKFDITKNFDGSISVSFPYDAELKDDLKSMGATWNPYDKTWNFDKDEVKKFQDKYGKVELNKDDKKSKSYDIDLPPKAKKSFVNAFEQAMSSGEDGAIYAKRKSDGYDALVAHTWEDGSENETWDEAKEEIDRLKNQSKWEFGSFYFEED